MFQVSLMAARGILPTPPLAHQAFTPTPSKSSRRKQSPSQNSTSHSSARRRRRKRGPVAAHAAQNDRDWSHSATPLTEPPLTSVNLVTGQVKILKRGEKWSPPPKNKEISASTMKSPEFFAGTTFDKSPPPSALPLPSLALFYNPRRNSICSCC